MVVKEAISDKNNKKSLVVIVAMVLILAIGLFVGYKKVFSSKTIFVKNVNKEYKQLENLFDKYDFKNTSEKPVVLTSNFKFNIDVDGKLLDNEEAEEVLSELNKLGLSSQIGIDSKKMEALVRLKALYDDESILNMGAYLKDNSVFIELKDLFDKYIEIPVETNGTLSLGTNSMDFKDVDIDDVKYLISKTKDMFLNSLNEKDFKKSSDKVKINGKEIKVTKLSYNFSEKNSYELYKKLIKSMTKDSKYIKTLAKLSGEKEQDIKAGLEAGVKMFDLMGTSDLDTKTIATLSVYTKGVSGLSFEFGEKETKTEIAYYHNDDDKVFDVKLLNEEFANISYNDKGLNATFNREDGKVELSITKEQKDKKIIYNYVLETEDAKIKGKLVEEIVKENKDGSGESKITFSLSTIGVKLELSGKVKVEYKDKLNMPDTSNSVKYDEMDDGFEDILEELSDGELGSLLNNIE